MGTLSPESANTNKSSYCFTRSPRKATRRPSSLTTSESGFLPPPKSPSAAKSRRMDGFSGFDPYQVFEVNHLPCMILTVKVINGKNISSGWAQDLVDTPDPYIRLRVRNAPNSKQRTKTIDNECNPVWNETFTFLLDFRDKNIIQFDLMEANYMYDQVMGTVYFDTCKLQIDEWHHEKLIFYETSQVFVEILLQWDKNPTLRYSTCFTCFGFSKNPTLRYSLCLCEGEKSFRENRRLKAYEGLNKLLGDRGPKSVSEVPTVAVIGSGGGFRAMTAFSGVFKALINTGILDCTTYAGGLSGSSWFLSTLYSHPDWPNVDPDVIIQELMKNVDSSILWLLKPKSVYRYLDRILQKRREGQPVSFTDFFGHMVGETLLKGRLDVKLTDQRARISDGAAPMPLYTCVHVKKDVPARSFQEWVEFTPYEIGFPKYGTFMDSTLFGSKFFMGKLCTKYEEAPLHFLQGIWGSAFCILFKRLLDDNRKLDPAEMIRQEMVKELEKNQEDELADSSDSSSDETDADGESSSSQEDGEKPQPVVTNGGGKGILKHKPDCKYENKKSGITIKVKQNGRRVGFAEGTNEDKNNVDVTDGKMTRKRSSRRMKKKSYWKGVLEGIFENKNFELLSTRAGRAAVIHNFMRGLSLQQTYPLSPFTPVHDRVADGDEFDGIFEMHPTNIKHIYMVDAGLTFNSPYPLVLRPQRGVDIILSFDFSARPSDCTPPFKELLLAEKWAKLNRLPFPPIDPTIVDREGLKELYIFKHPTDPCCPIVLHFPLVNIAFREFSKPGVKRESKEDLEFANFDLFDDPATPYSTFNFKYSHEQFTRLSKLTEFNTLLHLEEIKSSLAECVERKRANPNRKSINAKSFKLLRMQSIKERRKLKKFVERVDSSVRSSCHGSESSPLSSPDVQQEVYQTNGDGEPSSNRDATLKRHGVPRKSTLSSLNSITENISLNSPTDEKERFYSTRDTKRQCGFWPKPAQYIDDESDIEDDDVWYDAVCNSEDDEDYEISIFANT
ncbi:hypothetical protein SNE40_000480 [Patella caerulea]|uniref:Phospholipase A2 n=1 Tax=Patella caerulea TaxID=87958 RepID=A0AAN8K584_PATCE